MKLRIVITALIVLLLGGVVLEASDRPNIVWLISEDNSKHYLSLFDKYGVETPNINGLAKNGVVFDRAFSNAPVCSVARSTLITGCYAPRIGTQFHRKFKAVKLPPEIPLFPSLLRKSGYYTTNNSKKDYNFAEPSGLWDESSKKANWRSRDQGQPFFHKQSFGQSHEGSLHFRADKMNSQGTSFDASQVFVSPKHPQTKLFRFTNAYYRDRISLVDNVIGNVVAKLKNDGLLESTFVFYFADHGGVLPGSKGYLYETGLHIPLVIHIPEKFKHLVPDEFQKGARSKRPVEFVDLAATALSLAGVEIPHSYDGTPFLGAKAESEKGIVFGYADRFDEKYDLVRSIRNGNFKYIRNFEPWNFDGLNNNYRYRMAAYRQWRDMFRKGVLNPVQAAFFRPKAPEMLFDLRKDPNETTNLADDPKHRAELLDLRRMLNDRLAEMPDLSFMLESSVVGNGYSNPVAFGKQNQGRITELIRIANLQLEKFDDVADELSTLLEHEDWLVRYWAVNSCLQFVDDGQQFVEQMRKLAKSDRPYVAAAAAQFLGIAGKDDPGPLFAEILKRTGNRIETAKILNQVVLLKDGYGIQFHIERDWFEKRNQKDAVERLLLYLLPQS